MFAARPTDTNASAVISVSQLNRSVRDHLERRFPLMWIAGEISNFRRYDSGHCYFTLKDADAQVRCVMFRTRAQHLDWEPQDGMQVDVRALVSIYEPRGDFQLNIEAMRRSGLGPLYERFVRLKAELDAEGVFDAALKRPIPAFAQRVGVITSLAAAALRDILSTLARRNPSIEVILYPVPVQGEGAAQRIAQAIATASARAECDVLILARGGGSIEDLWSFNEAVVARAIRASHIPVVSGIGHETDFTIADFAADLKNKEVNYNLYLQSKPILVIQYLEELGYSKFNRYSQFGHNILLFKHKDKQFTELELFMDYLNFKCYLLNTHPAKKFGE